MTTTMQPQTVNEHNVGEHVHNLLIMASAVRETQRAIYELRAAITAYMQAENSTVWTDGKVSATLKPGAPSYLVNEVRAALGEITEPETMAKLIIEHETCKACDGSGERPPFVDGVVANSVKRRGDRYKSALETNCVRADPVLSVEEVK